MKNSRENFATLRKSRTTGKASRTSHFDSTVSRGCSRQRGNVGELFSLWCTFCYSLLKLAPHLRFPFFRFLIILSRRVGKAPKPGSGNSSSSREPKSAFSIRPCKIFYKNLSSRVVYRNIVHTVAQSRRIWTKKIVHGTPWFCHQCELEFSTTKNEIAHKLRCASSRSASCLRFDKIEEVPLIAVLAGRNLNCPSLC